MDEFKRERVRLLTARGSRSPTPRRLGSPRLLCLAALLASAACASHPPMQPGLTLQADRGHWIDKTRFEQRGKEVDRGSAKDALKATEESAAATRKAEVLEVGAAITRTAGILLLAWGISERVGGEEVNRDTANKLLIGGGACVGVSLGFAFGSDALYVDAVDAYNEQLRYLPE